ncbi:MAG TPA: LysM peptidoglycan-binding domain-containing protein [Actinomycetota bacterium]|nr:LysM peptidoglycan-binding domain-containing protein [Actinomycetota bacterium]
MDALVRSADFEASRMAYGGRVELAHRDRTAFRLVYRALRDRAARVRPGEIVSEPRWMRAVSALSWLRHRQRAALILDAMTPLTVADIAEVTNVSEHEAERIIATAVSSVARALGRPTDVRSDLAEAAAHLRTSEKLVPASPEDSSFPRRVVRLLLDPPPARAPEPPTFAPEVTITSDMTPVDVLLTRSEIEEPDITFAAPTPPKPPIPIPAGLQRRDRKVARDGLVALGALVVVIFALLPMSSKAVRSTIDRPSSPVVQAVTKTTPPAARAKAIAAPHVRVARGDSLWAIAQKRLHDPMRWREIWRLNRGKVMKSGQRFTDPDLIRPGWVLKIPG